MAFFNSKQIAFEPRPIPPVPPYVPPTPPTPPTPTPGSDPVIPRPTFLGEINVKLYQMSDEIEKVNKNLINGLEFTIDVQQDTDSLEPVLILDTANNLNGYNYMYIDVTNRYYFIRPEMLRGTMWTITGKVDALKSFADGIMAVPVIADKLTGQYANKDFNDGSMLTQSGIWEEVILWQNGFDDDAHNILIAAGGGAS